MPWSKKKGGAKPVTTFDVQSIMREKVNEFLTKRAAQGWFINGVTADGPDTVLVVSCKKSWPKPKPIPVAEPEDE